MLEVSTATRLVFWLSEESLYLQSLPQEDQVYMFDKEGVPRRLDDECTTLLGLLCFSVCV